MLDETAMVPGRLDEAGLRNLEALGCLVQWQKVRYDFHFHTADFDCDIVSGRSCDFIAPGHVMSCDPTASAGPVRRKVHHKREE